ncbi:hypothetical protein Tco_0718862 [Tanacetum coccineum]
MAKRAQPVLYDADTLLHPTHHPVSIWDSEEVLVHQVELSREQAYWLPANERASQTSNPNSPVTPFVRKSRPPSQVLTSLRNVNAVFPQFEGFQGKDDTLRNLETQIQHHKKVNVVSTEDGLKVENVSLKRRYDELSQANTHSRTANTEKLSALTAENTKLKAQVTGKTRSDLQPPENNHPKCLPPGMYNLETNKPVTEPRKPMPKSDTRNHRIWPSKSENARRAAIHNRNLNFDHNQFVIRSLKSVNTKTPHAKHNGNHTKKVWKATRKHNVNTTKDRLEPKKGHDHRFTTSRQIAVSFLSGIQQVLLFQLPHIDICAISPRLRR